MELILFYRCTVDSKIYVVHTPINAVFIKLGKVLKFTLKCTLISLLHVSVYDHHQGACTALGQSYIFVKTLSKITSLYEGESNSKDNF